jgi:hypothetical protein
MGAVCHFHAGLPGPAGAMRRAYGMRSSLIRLDLSFTIRLLRLVSSDTAYLLLITQLGPEAIARQGIGAGFHQTLHDLLPNAESIYNSLFINEIRCRSREDFLSVLRPFLRQTLKLFPDVLRNAIC